MNFISFLMDAAARFCFYLAAIGAAILIIMSILS